MVTAHGWKPCESVLNIGKIKIKLELELSKQADFHWTIVHTQQYFLKNKVN